MKKLILSLGLLVFGFSSLVSCRFIQHEHTYGQYEHDDKEHWQECTVIGCNQVINKESHHGGNATCTEFAVCDDCGINYGTKKEHIFVDKIDDKYLINKGDCENDTTYYKSCECGEKSSETFTSKVASGHSFTEWTTKTPADCLNAEVEHRTCLVEGCLKEEVRTGDNALNHNISIKHDSNQHWEECTREGCTYSTSKVDHISKLVPNSNLTHKVICEGCSAVLEENVSCSSTSSSTCVDDAKCLCGNVVEEKTGHVDLVSTYKIVNNKLYYSTNCSCGDSSKVEITNEAEVSNENELKTVLEHGFDAKLVSNITLTSPLVLDGNGVDCTLNLNGKEIEISLITVTRTQFGDRNIVEAILVKNSAKLTINGEGLIYSHFEEDINEDVYIEVVSCIDGATVNINGGSYLTNGCTAIYATRGGIVNINGGRFEATEELYNGSYTLDINEAEANVGTINVYGGTFVNYNPTNATHDGEYKNKVIGDKCIISIAGTYFVNEHDVVVDEGKEATCEEIGLTEGSHCSKCKKILVYQEEIEELGHSYSSTWIDSLDHKFHIIGCLNCGLSTEKELHYGGTPTLTNRPICKECGLEYSSKLVQEEAKPSGIIEFVNKELENGVSLNEVVISIDEYTTLTLYKGDARSNPAYYDSDKSLHIYKGNTWTISSSQVINNITITSVNANALSSLLDEVDIVGAIIGENVISNINSKTFTVTHHANEGTTQFRPKSITINYATPEPTRIECAHTNVIYVESEDDLHSKKCEECEMTIKMEDCYLNSEATCTEDGICVCGHKLEDKLGHSYGELINKLESTCTQDGYKSHYYCEKCSTYFDENKIEVEYDELVIEKEHKDLTITKGYEATCLEDGLKDLIHCNICNTDIQTQEVIPALGHNIVEDKFVASTCTQPGLTPGSHCSRCDEATVPQNEIPALGHSHPDSWSYVDSYYHGKECSRCHEVELELHDDGTDINSGLRTCETCNEEYGVDEFYAEAKINSSATLDGTNKSASHRTYTDEWEYDNWIISGGANNNGDWDYFKLGGSASNLEKLNDIHLRTNGTISTKVSKIEVVINDGSGNTEKRKVESWCLIVASDANFTNVIDRISGEEITNKAATYTFTPTMGTTWPENSYYKIQFDCINTTTSTTNGIIVLSKVNVYNEPLKHQHSYDPSLVKVDASGYVQVCTCGDSTKKELF